MLQRLVTSAALLALQWLDGNDWVKRDRGGERSSSCGGLVIAPAELFHHCQSPGGLSLSSVQRPTSPSPSHLPLSLVFPILCICAISLFFYHSEALSGPPRRSFVLPFPLYSCRNLSQFFPFFSSCQTAYPPSHLSRRVLPSPISLPLRRTSQESGIMWAVGGGIDLTLCCSSHRAIWHSTYVTQTSACMCVCLVCVQRFVDGIELWTVGKPAVVPSCCCASNHSRTQHLHVPNYFVIWSFVATPKKVCECVFNYTNSL